VFAMLLTMLPSLQEVVIWQHNRSLRETAIMVSFIAQATLRASPTARALRKLRSFRFGQRGENEDNGRGVLLPFTAIPSLWHIAGVNTNLQVPPISPNPFQEIYGWRTHPPTNVQSLVFEKSTVGAAAIPYLLEQAKFTMLRSFWYEIDGGYAYINRFSPEWIITALIQYARETLEELCFVVRSKREIVERWKGVLDVKAFKRLQVLEIESAFLCQGEKEKLATEGAKSLGEVVPETVEKVRLICLCIHGFHAY
jgi:hypothetical protein